uniref:Disease resistance N-terminal domain-containing protein n=1 Tax=Arundo donax TaxID=35708 RepID=A0A0A9D2N0_ARUDO
MVALFASMAVKSALDNLSSLLSATPTSAPLAAAAASWGVEDLRMLEETMRRISAALHDAEQHWNLREESTKLRLKELKDLAYDAEDVVEEYEYEVHRCTVEAFEQSSTILQDGGSSSSSSKRRRQEVQDKHYSIEAGIVPVPSELALRARKVVERFTEIKDYYGSFSLSENDGERSFS